MAKRNFKYNNTVDLSSVPKSKSGKIYNWKQSVGCIVPFTFDDKKLIGEFKIIDYKTPEGLTHPHIYLKYNNNLLKPILTSNLINGKINQILDEYYIDWVFEIGQILKDNKRDITIIDRKRIKDSKNCFRKYYKIKCNKCGFDGGKHYIKGEYKNDYWVLENDLTRNDKRRINCPCCSNRIVVTGINDIPTTDPWMISYFQGGSEEAKKYSKSSNVKIYLICPYCKRISTKQYKISNLYCNNGLSCICNDNFSYPNKYAFFFFEQLKDQYKEYINEYSPEWAKLYRYDNYIVLNNNKKYIVEMDGLIGHGNYQYKSNKQDIEGIKRDNIKDELAIKHNIKVIRINCNQSRSKYIKNNLINKLKDIFDLSNIDWELIDSNCHNTNFYKEICEYYNKTNLRAQALSKHFNISLKMIYTALKTGNKFNWCDYKFKEEISKKRKEKIINYWNNNKCKTSDVAKFLKCSQSTVINVLKEANENGLCNYNSIVEIDKNNKERGTKIYVYDKSFNLLKIYENIGQCIENCLDDFNVQFCKRCIYNVCNKKLKTHKNYIFSYNLIDKPFNIKKEPYKTVVYVYDMNLNFLAMYNSNKECSEKSLNDFGIHFNACNIALVCSKKSKHHKGYIFSHIKLEDK